MLLTGFVLSLCNSLIQYINYSIHPGWIEKYCGLAKLNTTVLNHVLCVGSRMQTSVFCRVLQMPKSSLQKVWRFGMLMGHVSSWISRVSAAERRVIWDQCMVSSGGILEQNTKICTQVTASKYSLDCSVRRLWHITSRSVHEWTVLKEPFIANW